MHCTVLADDQDKWTQASLGLNASSSLSRALASTAWGPNNAVADSLLLNQDLSILRESQKDSLGDSWFQARTTTKPSLTLACYHAICMLQFARHHHQSSSSKRESKQDFPHTWNHFVTQYLMMSTDSEQSSFHKSVRDTPWCFGLSEQLGISNPAHSLPTLAVSPGNQSPGLARLNEWGCLLILINNHWPWLLDELLLQPQLEYKGTKKYVKPICPLGSILEFHISIR